VDSPYDLSHSGTITKEGEIGQPFGLFKPRRSVLGRELALRHRAAPRAAMERRGQNEE
jgi:hypothetical protein